MSLTINNWTRRPGRDTKYHLVDSIIATDAVTEEVA